MMSDVARIKLGGVRAPIGRPQWLAPSKRAHHAFTIVELLVVMAIIGVIIAILLPAVQKVREVAHRMTCSNNLHQMALAFHSYEDANGGLPPNYAEDRSRTDGSHNLYYGPFVPVLPFLELDNDSPFPDPMSLGWPKPMSWTGHCWHQNPFNRPPLTTSGIIPPPDPLSCPNPTGSTGIASQTWGAQGNFRVFSCPSQPYEHFYSNQGSVVLFFLYGIPGVDMPKGNPFWNGLSGLPQCADTNSTTAGTGCNVEYPSYVPGSYVIGRSDYVAVQGTFNDASHTNPALTPTVAKKYRSLFGWNINASLSRVPDGTSNTLLLSEFCGTFSGAQSQPTLKGWDTASWASNAVSVVFGTCPDPNNALSDGGSCSYQENAGRLGGGPTLGGWHSGLFNVAFADGSVRALHVGLDRSLLLSLAGYNDGDVFNDF